MSIGLYRGTVSLMPHDEAWDSCARETIDKLKELLGEDLIDVQHIGSTSIRNICAKPIIDIVLGVKDFETLLKHNDILEENGFIYRGQDHPYQTLYICGKDDFITHHIHAVIYDSDAWHNYINIRDYLNTHEEEAKAYEKLKKELCLKYPDDRKTYTAQKVAFIEDIIEKTKRCNEMLNDFYDESEPLIHPEAFYGKQKFLIEKCLIIFSIEIHSYLLNNYKCEQIALITACNGDVPVYALEYKGERIAFYLSAVGSAVAAQYVSEVHWITGARKFVMFGSCGSLDYEKTKGKFIIPVESYRGEGASYYYVPASEYIKIKTADRLAEIFEELKVPYVKGRCWTTDSMIRETTNLVARRKAEGCIAVEMELAGVEAICDFFDLTLYDFLEAGDVLSETSYEAEGLKDANHNIFKLLIALDVALKI